MTATQTAIRLTFVPTILLLSWFAADFRAFAEEPKDLAGCWKNQLYDSSRREWRTLCWYNVEIKDGKPVMTALSYTAVDKDALIADRFDNIQVGKGQWSYTVHVGQGTQRVELKRANATQYEGTYSVDGKRQSATRRLVKMETRREQLDEITVVLRRLEIAREGTQALIARGQQDLRDLDREIDQIEWTTVRQPNGSIVRIRADRTANIQRVHQMQATARLYNDRARLQELEHRTRVATETRDWLRERVNSR